MMCGPMVTFQTILAADEAGSLALIELPFDPRERFGKARAPVRVNVNGVVLRTTIAVYGGRSYIGFRREIRELARLAAGMTVFIDIELDLEPRVVEIPRDLETALRGDAAARAAWKKLSFTHQKEHAQALESAKRAETRASRLEMTLAMLRSKTKSAPSTGKASTKT